MEKDFIVGRLAAIMVTDLVGYSALRYRSEVPALELLEEHAGLVGPLFSKYHGIGIESIGDAFGVEFDRAVQAARCAMEIQALFHVRNARSSGERLPLIRQIPVLPGQRLFDEIPVQSPRPYQCPAFLN
jgi:class 3 adenylate cyclase